MTDKERPQSGLKEPEAADVIHRVSLGPEGQALISTEPFSPLLLSLSRLGRSLIDQLHQIFIMALPFLHPVGQASSDGQQQAFLLITPLAQSRSLVCQVRAKRPWVLSPVLGDPMPSSEPYAQETFTHGARRTCRGKNTHTHTIKK